MAAERDKAKAEHQEKISQLQQETLITMLKQMQQQQQNQQNLQAMLIAQQRQQNQILMALMDKIGEKLKLVDVTKLLFYVYKIFPVCSNWAFVDLY